MNINAAPSLQSSYGDIIPLAGVSIRGEISDLMACLSIEQTFRNTGEENIEAVYTFPLALDAVLLGLQVSIGNRTLKGYVIEKQQSEDRYEEAITDGDTVIMLQQAAPGMYTLNVGNLQSGETVTIHYRYGQLLAWTEDELRFHIPTTIAPRYGDPGKLLSEPHQIPVTDNGVSHAYTLSIQVKGLLSQAAIQSPSHRIAVAPEEGCATVTLANKAELDRDFVLNFKASHANTQSTCQLARDLSGYVALASFKPEIEMSAKPQLRNIKILVDCSGSMAGDAIQQARRAMKLMLESLKPSDYFNIILFGSDHEALFNAQQLATRENLDLADKLVSRIDANMGGTEIGGALKRAYAIGPNAEIRPDVLLITDGEIWNQQEVILQAELSGHRIFTVGVGASVSEGLVRDLASVTGGVCELVSPNEGMAEKIHRHFQRIYSPEMKNLRVSWPVTPTKQWPEKIDTCYKGDTLHVFAWFEQPINGAVGLSGGDGKGGLEPITLASSVCQSMVHDENLTLAKMAASHQLKTMADQRAKEQLAVEYQLMTPYTNYLVLDIREDPDKAQTLPTLMPVPQMLSAGWGGSGAVCASYHSGMIELQDICLSRNLGESSDDDIDLPVFSRNSAISPTSWIDYLNGIPYNLLLDGLFDIGLLELEDHGLPESTVDALQQLVDENEGGLDEGQIIVLFLLEIEKLDGQLFGKYVTRALRFSSNKLMTDVSAALKYGTSFDSLKYIARGL